MTHPNSRSHTGFKYAMVVLLLFINLYIWSYGIILIHLNFDINIDPNNYLLGILCIAMGITSIVGSIQSVKGFKEPNTLKKIIGSVLNFGFAILFILGIIINIINLYKALV